MAKSAQHVYIKMSDEEHLLQRNIIAVGVEIQNVCCRMEPEGLQFTFMQHALP
jgi:hypothetical protein